MKKRLWMMPLLLAFSLVAALWGQKCMANEGVKSDMDMKKQIFDKDKILIVYYSWGGRTRAVAEMIEKAIGCDIVDIKVKNAYPSAYQALTEQARKEISEGFKPDISADVKDFDSYEVIFVGSPNWWSTIAPPISTFLAGNDFSGKVVVPFITHGGGGVARCVSDMHKALPGATFFEPLVLRDNQVGRSDALVTAWIRDNLNWK